MRRAFLIIVLFATSSLAAVTSPAGAPPEAVPEALQGTWVVVAIKGQDLPAGMHASLVISGAKYQSLEGPRVTEFGTLTVNTAKQPWAIDLAVREGVRSGSAQLGLVDVTGDTMTLMLAAPGAKTRPAVLGGDSVTLVRTRPLARELDGIWSGALEAAGATRRLSIAQTNDAGGLATGKAIGVDQDSREAPIAAVVVRGARVTLILPAIRRTLDAELEDGTLSGRWTQAGRTVTVVLRRSPT